MSTFLPQELIRRKRNGDSLSTTELQFFVNGLHDGSITDAQVGAFAMAVYFQGMSPEECIALTCAMRDSGDVLNWDNLDLPGPIIDKHSTGGVGDGVSLILGPLLAACGAYVPMISGRGLGHTGGTLDKLEAIPGYQTTPDSAAFRRTVQEAGVAIIGQTGSLAPADGRFYAIRDVTATVESIGLITASILSKKLAAGLQALVMDVKVGNGAFMPSLDASRELAQSIARVATGAGTKTTALLTDMNQCLGNNAGNALEVREAVAFLTGEQRKVRLEEVTLALGSDLLVNCGLSPTPAEAEAHLQDALASGNAAESFARMVTELGGPPNLLEKPDHHLTRADVIRPVHADQEGIVQQVDTRELGMIVVRLGGGRTRPDQSIDHAVGLGQVLGPGERTDSDRPLAIVHARSPAEAEEAARALRAAYLLGDHEVTANPVIIERVNY